MLKTNHKVENIDECIILKTAIINENDKLVTVFSKLFGKKNLLAKNACKVNSKLCGITDTINIIKYVPKYAKSIYLITQAQIVHPLINIKSNEKLFFRVYIICELIFKALEYDVKMSSIYNQTKTTILLLEKYYHNILLCDKIIIAFLVHFLVQSGYMFNLNCCSKCGKNIKEYYYNFNEGSFICKECAFNNKNVENYTYFLKQILNILKLANNILLLEQYKMNNNDINHIFLLIKNHIYLNLGIKLESFDLIS